MKLKKINLDDFAYSITAVLVALKLDGVINIPWIWVVSPIWIGLIIAIVVIVKVLRS